MRPLLVAVLLVPGCLSLADDASSCREGEGEFFVKATHNRDFYGSAEDLEKDRFEALSHQGSLFSYHGKNESGRGRVYGPPSAFHNVTSSRVMVELKRIGEYSSSRDYNVTLAWMDTVRPAAFEELCQVLHSHWDVPRDASGKRIGCADGGTVTYRFATSHGTMHRTGGCVSDQTMAEYENQAAIDAAFRSVVQESEARIGLT